MQDRLVVSARLWLVGFKQSGGFVGIKEGIGNESLLFEEPAEDDARDEADQAQRIAPIGVPGGVFGEANVIARPEIPVGQLLIELLRDLFDVERASPFRNPYVRVRVVRPLEVRQIKLAGRAGGDAVALSKRDERRSDFPVGRGFEIADTIVLIVMRAEKEQVLTLP